MHSICLSSRELRTVHAACCCCCKGIGELTEILVLCPGGAPQGAAQQPAEYKMKAANGAYDHTQRQVSTNDVSVHDTCGGVTSVLAKIATSTACMSHQR